MIDKLKLKFAILVAQIRGSIRSKTIWFNATVLALLGQIPVIAPIMADQLPAMQPYMGPKLFQYLMGAVLIVNLILRFKTKTALEAK